MKMPGMTLFSASNMISSRALVGLEQFMKSKGLDCAQLGASAGIDCTVVEDLDGVIAIESFAHLLELATQQCGDEAFGLKFGAQFPVGPLGVYSYLVISAATLRDAVQASARFVRLVTSAYGIETEQQGCALYYKWHFPPPLRTQTQLIDCLVALLVARVRQITGVPGWTPVSVEFAHPAPQSLRDYVPLFGGNMTFGASLTRLGIDAVTLDKPSAVHDPYLTRTLQAVAERMLGLCPERSGFLERAAGQIVRSLPKGEATEADIAAALGTSVRELHREFAAAGTTFTSLRDEVRMETAKRLLTDTDLQLTEITFLLGFSELSVFSRTAKTWFGVAPSVYRRQFTTGRGTSDG
jgi:AraC-like DNA-binding protein